MKVLLHLTSHVFHTLYGLAEHDTSESGYCNCLIEEANFLSQAPVAPSLALLFILCISLITHDVSLCTGGRSNLVRVPVNMNTISSIPPLLVPFDSLHTWSSLSCMTHMSSRAC